MISVGGWSDSRLYRWFRKIFSTGSQYYQHQQICQFRFVIPPTYKFDGLDLDWEFPSTTADHTGFKNLIVALKTAFKPYGFLLSAAVSPDVSTIDAGNIK